MKYAGKAAKVTVVLTFTYNAATQNVVCAAEGATRDAMWPYLDIAESIGTFEVLNSYQTYGEGIRLSKEIHVQQTMGVQNNGLIPPGAGPKLPWAQ